MKKQKKSQSNPTNSYTPTQRVFFAGGGSGGHTIPALTLIKEIKSLPISPTLHYIGRHQGIERNIIASEVDFYHGIFTGKFRRYFSLKHFSDFFGFLWGFAESIFILFPHRFQKVVMFSTGGFVSLSPVLAGRIMGYTVYLHEQTSQAGLANKIASYFCHKVFVSFENSRFHFPAKKTFYSGYPLRREIELVKSQSPVHELTFNGEQLLTNLSKPSILITGGSNGSLLLNKWTDTYLKELLKTFTVFHQVGNTFIEQYQQRELPSSYHIFGFSKQLISLLQYTTVVITRSGAGIVSELIYLNKLSLFVPLKIAQRNEQYFNALEAKKKIPCEIVLENDFLNNSHLNKLNKLIKLSKTLKKNTSPSPIPHNAREFLVKEIIQKS